MVQKGDQVTKLTIFVRIIFKAIASYCQSIAVQGGDGIINNSQLVRILWLLIQNFFKQ